MEDTIACPNCGNENAYFSNLDEDGAHYACPDCDHEWCDSSVKIDDEIDEDNKL